MKGKRSFESVMDIRDALEDVKAQVNFLSYTTAAIAEMGCGDNLMIAGMCLTFDQIENQIDEIDKALQDNIYEVTGTITEEVLPTASKLPVSQKRDGQKNVVARSAVAG